MFNTTALTFAKIYRKILALRYFAVFAELILDKTRQNRRATRRFGEDINAVLDEPAIKNLLQFGFEWLIYKNEGTRYGFIKSFTR